MAGTQLGNIERFLRKDRLLVVLALALLTILAWLYLLMITKQMGMTLTGGMKDLHSMMKLKPWTVSDAIFVFAMWTIMMVGMMIPSASPMILLYARVLRKNFNVNKVSGFTSVFLIGYLVVWTGFSAVATFAQWVLEKMALLSPMMVSSSTMFGGIVLVIAGIYQWTPYKHACLERCRDPVWFLSNIWQEGYDGAFMMGIIHGAFCLGCCWALMALLFVGGVMNLLWVAVITFFVLIEKLAPFGSGIGRVSGLGLFAFGIYTLLSN